jgi:ABC-type lipoprotein release transport system permease subunit
VVVLIISFFSLVTTTYVNIVNQTNEIGILMILGYEKSRIVRIYIYECFILVINSCVIGIGVGYFVAWMMGLQRELFSDLPVTIEVKGLPIIVFAAIASSILSTYKPLKEIFNNTISQIMNYAK